VILAVAQGVLEISSQCEKKCCQGKITAIQFFNYAEPEPKTCARFKKTVSSEVSALETTSTCPATTKAPVPLVSPPVAPEEKKPTTETEEVVHPQMEETTTSVPEKKEKAPDELSVNATLREEKMEKGKSEDLDSILKESKEELVTPDPKKVEKVDKKSEKLAQNVNKEEKVEVVHFVPTEKKELDPPAPTKSSERKEAVTADTEKVEKIGKVSEKLAQNLEKEEKVEVVHFAPIEKKEEVSPAPEKMEKINKVSAKLTKDFVSEELIEKLTNAPPTPREMTSLEELKKRLEIDSQWPAKSSPRVKSNNYEFRPSTLSKAPENAEELTVKFTPGEQREEKSDDDESWGTGTHSDYFKYLKEQGHMDEEGNLEPEWDPQVTSYVDNDPKNWDLNQQTTSRPTTTTTTTTTKAPERVRIPESPEQREKKWDSWVEMQLENYLDHLKGMRSRQQEKTEAPEIVETRVVPQEEVVPRKFGGKQKTKMMGSNVLPVLRQGKGSKSKKPAHLEVWEENPAEIREDEDLAQVCPLRTKMGKTRKFRDKKRSGKATKNKALETFTRGGKWAEPSKGPQLRRSGKVQNKGDGENQTMGKSKSEVDQTNKQVGKKGEKHQKSVLKNQKEQQSFSTKDKVKTRHSKRKPLIENAADWFHLKTKEAKRLNIPLERRKKKFMEEDELLEDLENPRHGALDDWQNTDRRQKHRKREEERELESDLVYPKVRSAANRFTSYPEWQLTENLEVREKLLSSN